MCFEHLGLRTIETHERDQWLDARCTLLVCLQVDIHLVALTEHARYAGNQLLSVLHQRVDSFVFVSVLFPGGIVERILEVDALAAQHDGTDWDSLLLFVQVRNDE